MPNPKEHNSGSVVPKKLIPEDSAYKRWQDRRVIICNSEVVEAIIRGEFKRPEPEDTEPKDEWSDLPDIPGRKRKP